jgi:hypothetical protein
MVSLFDPTPYDDENRAAYFEMSDTQRRTARQRSLLAAGVHPATGLALAGNGETCGNCAHLTGHSRTRTYWKCDLVATTHGPGTDIRLGWPACIRWEPR